MVEKNKWLSVFAGVDEPSAPRPPRPKPNGDQDQGRKDEND